MSNSNTNYEINTGNTQEREDENVFKKAENVKKVSEFGGGAKILFANFKKQKIDDAALGLHNDFISDGGLKEKLNKYTHSSNFNSNNALKNTKINTNFPTGSNYQQLSTYNGELKVTENQQKRNSLDAGGLSDSAQIRKIYSIMDQKVSQKTGNVQKNMQNLRSLSDKIIDKKNFAKTQNSNNTNLTNVTNNSNNKILLKSKKNSTLKSFVENNQNKKSTIFSKKGQSSFSNNETKSDFSKKEEMTNQIKEIYDSENRTDSNYNNNNDLYNEEFNQENPEEDFEYNENENLIEKTKKKFDSEKNNFPQNQKAKLKAKSLPKNDAEIRLEQKKLKNNFLETRKNFALTIKEQNAKRVKSQKEKNAKMQENQQIYFQENQNENSTSEYKEKSSDLFPNKNSNNENSSNSKITENNYANYTNENANNIIPNNEKNFHKIFTTEEKWENIEKINNILEQLEIKKFEKESMNIMKPKLDKVQKKINALQKKGVEINFDELDANLLKENEENDNKILSENENENEENEEYVFHEEDNRINNDNSEISQINNYINKSKIINNHNQEKIKLNKKPIVDTLEFVKKISNEKRKFNKSPEYFNEALNVSDSFRRSNSDKTKNRNYNNNKFLIDESVLNEKIRNMLIDKDNEKLKEKKNIELKEFIDRKKREKKMIELKVKEENKKFLDNKFLQLIQLQKNIDSQKEKLNYYKKSNSSISNNQSRQSNSVGNKVKNDYYIGSRKNNNNKLDESSILDPNDFYYSVLESKNIIVTNSQNSNKILSGKNSNISNYRDIGNTNNNLNFKTTDEFVNRYNNLNLYSKLSDFTGNNFNINKDNKKLEINAANKTSQENFLKFISEQEKNTLKSFDTSNFNKSSEQKEKENISNINNNKNLINTNTKSTSSNNNNNNYLNSRLTDNSKLNSKSSNLYPGGFTKAENLFENNLINNLKIPKEKEDYSNINENESLNPSPKFENENEGNINKNSDLIVESEKSITKSDIDKDSFLLQLDNVINLFCNRILFVYQKKYFIELYTNIVQEQQIKDIYLVLQNLCNIGKRDAFDKIQNYSNNVYIENIYNVFNNLTLFAKRDAFIKIFEHFSSNKKTSEENEIQEQEVRMLQYFVDFFDQFFMFEKKEAFSKLLEYAKNFSLYNDLQLNSDSNNENEHLKYNGNNITTENDHKYSMEESEISEERVQRYLDYFNTCFLLMTRFSKRRAFEKIKEYYVAISQINNQSYRSEESKISRSNVSDSRREKIILSKKSSKNESSFNFAFNQNKANSFIANSNNSSSLCLYPNSLDSPRIARLKNKIARKNLEKEWNDDMDAKYNLNKKNSSIISSNNEEIYFNTQNDKKELDENVSKNINYSKLDIDDNNNFNSNKSSEIEKVNLNISKNNLRNSLDNDIENSLNSSQLHQRNSGSINANKYSNLNYNDEFNKENKDKNDVANSINSLNSIKNTENKLTKSIERQKISSSPDKESLNENKNKIISDKNTNNNQDNSFDKKSEEKNLTERDKSQNEEIAEDIQEDPLSLSRRKSSGLGSKIICTDISVDREMTSDIEWMYNISQSKSGSLRGEVSQSNLSNKFNEISVGKFEENNKNNLNEKKEKDLNLSDKKPDFNYETKKTEENYDEYNDFDIVEDIIIDDEPDLTKLLGEESISISNFQNSNGAIGLTKSRNSNNNKNNIEQNFPEKNNNNSEAVVTNTDDDVKEKEIDLENNRNFKGKETLDSLRGGLKSIESEDNDFFKVKSNKDQNILNLLDDISSNNNKSHNPQISSNREFDKVSDVPSVNLKSLTINKDTITSEIDNLGNQNKTLSVNQKSDKEKKSNNNSNKRYDSIENSDKKFGNKNIFFKEMNDLSKEDMELISEDIANSVINEILKSEIKDDKMNFIPKKNFKNESSLQDMINSLNKDTNKFAISFDSSMVSTVSGNLFSKSVIEQKKEISMKLYIDQIGPKLIEEILNDITGNFDEIVKNLNQPYKHNAKEVIIAMSFRDRNRLQNCYKILDNKENAKNFVKKEKIIKKFEPKNKEIRKDDNIISDDYYDNILNECLIDAGNEIMEKERKELTEMLNYHMGMIPENYEFLDPDQLAQEREKKSINHINKELCDSEEMWKNYEFEETQVKLELSELVVEILLNEIVEILEHIYCSRKKPDLYQYKSIYACEDIPRLSFQQTNTDIDLDNINQ